MTDDEEPKPPVGQDPDQTISDFRDIEELRGQQSGAFAAQETVSAFEDTPPQQQTVSDFQAARQPAPEIEDTPPPGWAAPDSATLETPKTESPAAQPPPPPTAIAPPVPYGPNPGMQAPPPVTPGFAMPPGQGPVTPGGGFPGPGMPGGPGMGPGGPGMGPGGPGMGPGGPGMGPGGPGMGPRGPGMPPPGPYTPQPFGQPGMPGMTPQPFPQPFPQQGFGPGYGPPPRQRNNALLVGGIVGGVIVLVVIVMLGLVVGGVFSTEDPKVTAAKRLAEAAKNLAPAKAVKYHGTLTSGSDSLDGDFKVTSSGRTSASVTWSGSQAQFILVDDNLFVKSDSNYWKSVAAYAPQGSGNTVDASKWGKRAASAVTFDFRSYLTAGSMAAKLRGITKLSITSSVKTTSNGVNVLKVSTYGSVYYVSADGAARLLRVENSSVPSYALDVDVQGGSDTLTELRNNINALKDSFDTTALMIPEKVAFGRCESDACTINQKVTVTRSPAPVSPGPITAHYTFTKQDQNGAKLGECTATGTPGADGTVTLSCNLTGSAWSSYWGDTSIDRKVWAKPDAYTAGGASDNDIQSMLGALDKNPGV